MGHPWLVMKRFSITGAKVRIIFDSASFLRENVEKKAKKVSLFTLYDRLDKDTDCFKVMAFKLVVRLSDSFQFLPQGVNSWSDCLRDTGRKHSCR